MDFGGGDAWVDDGGFLERRTMAGTELAVSGEVVAGFRGSCVCCF
jgi:hypothetical protein